MNKQKIVLSLLIIVFVVAVSGCQTSYCLSGNCVNGYGTYTWASGSKYVGEWKDVTRNGQGTNTWADGRKYVGEYKDDKRNGQGTYTWPDGNKYVGEYKNDNQNGQGTSTWANGDKYVGEYKNDKKNGQGTYTWARGSKYVGEYNTWADGRKYVGEWKDDNQNGQGTYTWPDGNKYVGEYKDDKRNGQGIYTWPDGRKHVGEFKDNNINGQGTHTWADGRVVEGLWENNKRVATYSDTDKPVVQVAQSTTPVSRPVQTSPANRQSIGRRIALVIGNSRYLHTPALPNPGNDAKSIGQELTKLGFDTEVVLDVTKTSFDSALRRFGDRSESAAASLFFYAGHALEVDGINYLMPVDAKLEHKRDLKYETVALNGILEDMEGASQVRLVFLDACRDNPLSHSLARGMGTSRSVVGRGLARVDASSGTLISYATKTGAIADDGDGTHSPYTQALLDHMNTKGLDIGLMLRRVRSSVITSTNNKQTPWDSSSLLGEFYLVQ
jgi:hypothetical protein